jgi:AcrR family transcriptional regulator
MARPSSDIRDRILEAARSQFASSGVDGASLRQIAKEAGTGAAMVSYHFESKDGLFRAAVDSVYDGFLSDLQSLAESESAPLPRLKLLLGRMSRINDDERRMIMTIVREATVQSDRLLWVLGRFLQGHGALLMAAMEEAMDAGDIRRAPMPMILPLVMAPIVFPQVMLGTVAAAWGTELESSPWLALDLLFNGLLPRDGEEPLPVGEWRG